MKLDHFSEKHISQNIGQVFEAPKIVESSEKLF